MKISVISPTYNRQERHPNLYKAFSQQTYPDRELLVLDDSEEPSPFFSAIKDPLVKYFHLPCRMGLGTKRNSLVKSATGALIAHFDDDDYYGPTYLQVMQQALGQASLVKLSKWLAWRETDGTLWEWDATHIAKSHYIVPGEGQVVESRGLSEFSKEELERFLDYSIWGFGFSYLYRKSLWEECPFSDILGEDYDFILKARAAKKMLLHTSQFSNLVLHTVHPLSHSKIFPQQKLEPSSALALLGQEVAPWLIKI